MVARVTALPELAHRAAAGLPSPLPRVAGPSRQQAARSRKKGSACLGRHPEGKPARSAASFSTSAENRLPSYPIEPLLRHYSASNGCRRSVAASSFSRCLPSRDPPLPSDRQCSPFPGPLQRLVPAVKPLLSAYLWEYLVFQWQGEAITELSLQSTKAN